MIAAVLKCRWLPIALMAIVCRDRLIREAHEFAHDFSVHLVIVLILHALV